MIKKQTQQKHLQIQITNLNDDVVIDSSNNYDIDELISLKERLNSSKSKMDIYYLSSKQNQEMNRKWMQFQGIIDIYKPMRFEIQKKFNAKFVTNAWMKYWEMYSHYDVTGESSKFYAFFNAELPGATLSAFNHYMKTMKPHIDFDWRASSLAPSEHSKNELEALGDNYGLYANSKDKWIMEIGGDGNNGDVTKVENILDFEKKLGPNSEFGGMHLYSHDAGIDVSSNEAGGLGFNDQEIANARIHLGCAISGFLTLRPGGTFIAKQYTFFETFTWNLIIIYASLFEEFYISKPLTSRQYNSEIYLIGKNFKGIPDSIKEVLLFRLENFSTKPFIASDAIKIKYREQIKDISRAARIIHGQQVSFLDENIELFEKYQNSLNVLKNGIENIKRSKISNWLRTYPVKTIKDSDQLPHN
jgi:cap2 methyltransferase